MATAPANPFPTNWKAFYDQAESFWTKPLQELLAADSTVRWMGLTRESSLTQQAAVRDGLEAHWQSLRLPSKGDHTRLAGQIVALEAKVDAVADSLEALESRMDAILGKLELLAAAEGAEEAPRKARNK